MNVEPQRITVNLGNRTLNLRPLGRRDFDAAIEVARSMKVTVHGPPIDPWLKDCGDALGFIFIAARKNHPDLFLVELHEESGTQEIVDAFAQLINASRTFLVDAVIREEMENAE
jgi:hypothetical protein